MGQPQLVVALDTREQEVALALADQLRSLVPWLKVGLELFIHAGPSIVARLKDKGFKVFVDLKMYDIPHTVRGGVLSAAAAGADMLTIHAQGGERMAKAALEAAAEAGCAPTGQPYSELQGQRGPIILGVTVLTSMEPGELPAHTGDLGELAADLARRSRQWGLHGIVSSGHEVAAIKAACGPNFLCLTPGIRPATGEHDDQRRVMTPAEAVAAGSDFLVVGRPITRAADPVTVAREMTRQIHKEASA